MFGVRVHFQRDGAPFRVAQCGFEGFGQSLAHVVAHLEAVNDHIHRMLLALGQLGHVIDLVDLAVDTNPGEALGAQFGEQVLLLALAVGHHRGKDHQLGVFRQGQHVVHHLRDCLCFQWLLVFRAERRAGAGKHQAQVIVDLGDGADGRARVMAGRLLLDRNGRGKTFDQVDVRLFHQLQELAGVGRQ